MPSLGLPEGPAIVVVEGGAASGSRATDPASAAFGSPGPTALELLLATDGTVLPALHTTDSSLSSLPPKAISAVTPVNPRPSEPQISMTSAPAWGGLDPALLAGWILDDGLPVRLQIQLHKVLWPGETGSR